MSGMKMGAIAREVSNNDGSALGAARRLKSLRAHQSDS